jgi:hypothetical protein
MKKYLLIFFSWQLNAKPFLDTIYGFPVIVMTRGGCPKKKVFLGATDLTESP